MAKDRYLVIVDPYSPATLFPALKAQGLKLISVFSSFQPSEYMRMRNRIPLSSNFAINIPRRTKLVEIISLLKNKNIIGVMNGLESGYRLALAISRALHLESNPKSTEYYIGNKYRTGRYLQKFDLFPIQQIRLIKKTLEHGLCKAEKIMNFPVILKPTNSAASFGIFLCNTIDELRQAANNLVQKIDFLGNPINEMVIQDYLKGHEYAVCVISSGGYHVIVGVLSYQQGLLYGQNMIRSLEVVNPTSQEYAQAVRYTLDVLNACKFSYGQSAVELMITKKGPCLIELNPRMAGINVDPFLKLCTGKSQAEIIATSYADTEKFIKMSKKTYQIIAQGKIVFVRNLFPDSKLSQEAIKRIHDLPSCQQAAFNYKADEKMPLTTDAFNAVANIMLVNTDEKQLEKDYQQLLKMEKEGFHSK